MSGIPEVIHYCWFGHSPKPKQLLDCMETWKKYFPDYEIKEWNEDNFDITQNLYIQEAYANKKWAFVSDFARLAIVYQHGGIYFDTDVEVIKPFDDLLLKGGYLGFENTSNGPEGKKVNTGLGFAAEKGDPVIYEMMKDYENIHFVADGGMDMTPCPERNTRALIRFGLIPNGTLQQIGNITVYPFEYFCGIDIANSHPHITENTRTIHHYSATWKDKLTGWKKIKYGLLIPLVLKIIGYYNYDKLKVFLSGIKRK